MGRTFDAIVLALYPLIVLLGLTYLDVRWTALLLAVLLGRRFIAHVFGSKETSVPVLIQIVGTGALLVGAAWSGSEMFLRFTPFGISLIFFFQFAASLRPGSAPIIERFARLARPDLPPENAAYCRRLTKIWLIVFVGNSALVLAAAFAPDKATWALLVGPASYLYLGGFLSAEYIYRRFRFREWNAKNPLDRLLRSMSRSPVP
jgi:uncharacterized membrane protein